MTSILRLRSYVFCILGSISLCQALSQEEALDGKVRQLNELTTHQSIINLKQDQFELFLLSNPRNYSFVLLLTALTASRNCVPCKVAYDEFRVVSDSWRYSKHYDNSLYFAVSDFDNDPGIFELLRQETAPAIIYVSPKGQIKQSDYMDIAIQGLSAEAICRWISSKTGIKVRIFRPPSYTGTLLLALFMSLTAAFLYFRKINIDCLYNNSLWSAISLCVILCAISGQVYNHIRGPPLFHASPPKGEIKTLIYGGSDYQFVAETFIVMFLYMAASGGILLMNEVGSTTDLVKRKVYAIAGVGLFALALSLLLSVFQKKYREYPYRLN